MKRTVSILCVVLGIFCLHTAAFAQNDAMIITPQGDVGINTTEPSEKLEVNGNIKSTGRIQDATGLVMPVGAILPYALNEAPAGWLICDGSIIDKSVNPELADLVDGLRAAAGSNTEHPYIKDLTTDQARLPDLRGDFMRGVSTMQNTTAVAGVTPPSEARTDADPDSDNRTNPQTSTVIGAVVGSWQNDAFQTHGHNGSITTVGGTSAPVPRPYVGIDDALHGSTKSSFGVSIGNPTGTNVRTTSETRSDNTYVLYIIKY